MSNYNKRKRLNNNPDFRPRTNLPAPPIEEIEQRLRSLLTPNSFASARLTFQEMELRERILTLPVMVCFVVSLVCRQIPSMSELLRVCQREGLLDFEPFKVSRQALSKRLQSLPAELFLDVFNQALEQLNRTFGKEIPVAPGLAGVRQKFPHCYVADGSSLEQLRRRLKENRHKGTVELGGKMMCLLDLFSQSCRQAWYQEDAKVNDKRFIDDILGYLKEGDLLVVDSGFFSFNFFDRMTEAKKYFVTRNREKTNCQVIRVLSQGQYYRDEIIQMGRYRSNPCNYPVRQVSVKWGEVWYRYLTNVLDQEKLSARQVSELYRSRWRIEEAFLVTKRLLGLSYLWGGTKNAVEVQIYATWLFYGVLRSVSGEVAQGLKEPLESISIEMVFRSFYHFKRSQEMGEEPELIEFLVTHAKLLSLVKAKRKRHRNKDTLNEKIWGKP